MLCGCRLDGQGPAESSGLGTEANFEPMLEHFTHKKIMLMNYA